MARAFSNRVGFVCLGLALVAAVALVATGHKVGMPVEGAPTLLAMLGMCAFTGQYRRQAEDGLRHRIATLQTQVDMLKIHRGLPLGAEKVQDFQLVSGDILRIETPCTFEALTTCRVRVTK